jgi:hypothetical protein
MTTSIEEMQNHLETLAAELSCVMIQESNMGGMMYVEEEPSRIETPKLEYGVFGGTYRYTPRIAYMVGLHELGHVYHGHTQGRPPYQAKKYYFDNGVFKSEAEAWQFALENSIIEFEKEELAFGLRCFDSYLRGYKNKTKTQYLWNGNRHWVGFLPDPITPFIESVRKDLGAKAPL